MGAKLRTPDPSSNFSEQTSLALWGPTGAGKDWLFRAFAKELDYYNRQDPGFYYELSTRLPGAWTPIPMVATPPPPIPTRGIEEYNYIFRRKAIAQDFAHQISAQEHDIVIHNGKVANMVESLNDSITFESTFTALIQARHFLLVLGIPKEEMITSQVAPKPQTETDIFGPMMDARVDVKAGPNSLDALRGDWSRAEYLKFVQLLLAALGKTPRRNLAVCMTKSDQLNFRGAPVQMIERRYGRGMICLLELYAQQHNIKVFATSAAGYLWMDDHLRPNINDNGELRDTARWEPLNTVAPFFWIFEQIERERMQKGFALTRDKRIKAYIPYPDPRPF